MAPKRTEKNCVKFVPNYVASIIVYGEIVESNGLGGEKIFIICCVKAADGDS